MLEPRLPVVGLAFASGRDLRSCRFVVAGNEGEPFFPAERFMLELGVVAAVFPIIFLGELPDKTMFASLVLSTRGKPAAVWLGAAGAFVLHVAIATTFGALLFAVLPHRALDAVVAGLFFLGALYAFWESRRADHSPAASGEHEARRRSVVLRAFVVIFVAEWGDLTQLLTANLAVRYHDALAVGLGSLLALWAVAGLAVVSGQGLLRALRVETLRLVTAGVLLVLSGVSVWAALH